MPLEKLFKQWQGKHSGYSKGRERSFHFGSPDDRVIGMISHLGPQLSFASGVALSHVLRNESKISVAFSGEGGTSEGEFHEALNVAAVWDLPVVFVVENNGYGLSTPTHDQFRCKQVADKAIGYGIEGITIDGNNILEVYTTMRKIAQDLRENPRPILLECMTFRRRGHEEASGIKYVPKDLIEAWEKRDPLERFADYLLEIGVLTPDYIANKKQEYATYIQTDLDAAFAEPEVVPNLEAELQDVYAPVPASQLPILPIQGPDKRLVDAISNGLKQAMEIHPELVIMGQDVAEYGGVFKITEGFVEQFGLERVRNTPICESAIVGIGLGLALRNMKAVVEMQFADFVTCAHTQIVNNLAKLYYRWGKAADVVIRMPTGAGVGAGPFHSQSNEAWFFHTPGLKVVYPSTPYAAKGLLLASIADPNPVMFFEHKALYRSISGPVPEEAYVLEIGKARLVSEGNDVTIITYGMGVIWAEEWAKRNSTISVEILDLQTLLPLDEAAILDTAKKTGKIVVLHEDTLTGGIGAEIAARISEYAFEYLDAPVMRCASLDTAVPFAIPLEKAFLANSRLDEVMQKMLSY